MQGIFGLVLVTLNTASVDDRGGLERLTDTTQGPKWIKATLDVALTAAG